MTPMQLDTLDDEFWKGAFDANDPFYDGYVTEFRRGIIRGGEEDLRWARLALYSISDSALLTIISRLLMLSRDNPGADFVESLVFFLSNPLTIARVRRLLISKETVTLMDLSTNSAQARSALHERGDSDLESRLLIFESCLSESPERL